MACLARAGWATTSMPPTIAFPEPGITRGVNMPAVRIQREDVLAVVRLSHRGVGELDEVGECGGPRLVGRRPGGLASEVGGLAGQGGEAGGRCCRVVGMGEAPQHAAQADGALPS